MSSYDEQDEPRFALVDVSTYEQEQYLLEEFNKGKHVDPRFGWSRPFCSLHHSVDEISHLWDKIIN